MSSLKDPQKPDPRMDDHPQHRSTTPVDHTLDAALNVLIATRALVMAVDALVAAAAFLHKASKGHHD